MDHVLRRRTSQSTFYTLEEMAPSYEVVWSTSGNNGLRHKEKTQDLVYNGARPADTGCRPKNVVLFGETGAGKSSVINLLAGQDVAETSSGLQACTLTATEYSFTFPGRMVFSVFDTVGLEEPEMGVNTFFGAIKKAYELIELLHSTGGIDLLILCVRAGRITAAMQRNYRLFFNVLCGCQVPLAIVVTHLEQEKVMESWWTNNVSTFRTYDIHSVAHACVTALPADADGYANKRAESQKALRSMLLDALGNTNSPYVQEKQGWLVIIANQLRSLVKKSSKPLRRRNLRRRLETECMFTPSDAEKLAELLVTRTKGGKRPST